MKKSIVLFTLFSCSKKDGGTAPAVPEAHHFSYTLVESQPNDANAKTITVVGADVYVAGYEYNGSKYVAKYWKNRVGTNIASAAALDSRVFSMFITIN